MDNTPNYAELARQSAQAEAQCPELEQHLNQCRECFASPLGFCEVALKIVDRIRLTYDETAKN